MTYYVQKVWDTKAGLKAVVIMTDFGHRCGYVGVPTNHILYNIDYDEPCDKIQYALDAALNREINIDKIGIIPALCFDGKPKPVHIIEVHGGLTYARGGKYPIDLIYHRPWWFGFDCAHAGDRSDNAWAEQDRSYITDGIIRSLKYCASECESMALQLVSIDDEYNKRQNS